MGSSLKSSGLILFENQVMVFTQPSEAGFCLLCTVPCVEGIKVSDVAMNLGLFKKSQEPLSDVSLLVLSVGGN
jgi:hypothetical protein